MDPAVPRTEFSMTNKGFHITTTLTRSDQDFLLNLQCVDSSIQQAEGSDGMIAIRIIRTAHVYVRHASDRLVVVSPSNFQLGDPVHVHIPKDISFTESQSIKSRLEHRVVFELTNTSFLSCSVTKWPNQLWDPYTNSFLTDGYEDFTGLLKINLSGSQDDPRPTKSRVNSRASSPIPSSHKSSPKGTGSPTDSRVALPGPLSIAASDYSHSSKFFCGIWT